MNTPQKNTNNLNGKSQKSMMTTAIIWSGSEKEEKNREHFYIIFDTLTIYAHVLELEANCKPENDKKD